MKKVIFSGLAIALLATACRKPDPISVGKLNKDQVSIEELLKDYAPSPQTKSFNSEEVIRFTTDAGNKIKFPANSFLDASGNQVTGNVDISVTEITNISDMVLSGMMTNSDQGPLSSQGEFNVLASQNGQSLDLADGIAFTIENPNEPIDSALLPWFYIPADTFVVEGVTNINQGFWTQNEFEENNECDRVQKLINNIVNGNPSSNTSDYWNDIRAFRNYGLMITDEEEEVDGKNVVIVGQSLWGSYSLACNNVNDDWNYKGVSNILGSADAIVSSYSTSFNPDLSVNIKGCEVEIDGNSVFSFDPNIISVQFNNLSWCNIDALITQYGGINECKIKLQGIPKLAYVKCLFPDLNGATSCTFKEDGVFEADRLPSGMDVKFLVYYRDGEVFKCGSQTITASADMEFNMSNMKNFNSIDELVDEIKKISE